MYARVSLSETKLLRDNNIVEFRYFSRWMKMIFSNSLLNVLKEANGTIAADFCLVFAGFRDGVDFGCLPCFKEIRDP